MTDATQFLIDYGSPVVFAIVLAEQAGLPLPAAPWLLAAGALSATGKLSAWPVIVATALAALMADTVWFYVGRRGGPRVLRLFCRVSLSRNSCIGRTKGLFARHGLQALAAAKFLPGLGAVMPPLVGALGMGTGRFLLFDGLGALFYATFYISAGFLFHNQLGQVLAWLKRLGFGAVLLGLVLICAYVLFKLVQRRRVADKGIDRQATTKPATPSILLRKLITARAVQNATRFDADGTGSMALPEVPLMVTSSSAPAAVTRTTAALVANSP